MEHNFTIIPYNPMYSKEWDIFVRTRSRNGGIFHEQKFLSYHKKGKFQDMSILLYKGDKLFGVFPCVENESCNQAIIVSHPGSSYGGLVFHFNAKTRDVLSMLDGLINYYNQLNYFSIEMQLSEPIFCHPIGEELDFLLWHRGFTLKSKEISTCVQLSQDKIWKLHGRKKNITDINNLTRKGFEFGESDSLKEIYPIIENNLKSRYNKAPTHSIDELHLLKKLYPNKINLWLVKYLGKPICTAVSFIVNETAVHDFYIAQDYNYSKYNVMPFLFYNIFDHYSNKGFKWYNFGISSRKENIKWGILEFKERMGGRATTRNMYLLQNLAEYVAYQPTK